MQIVIENGKPTVKLLAGEQRSLREAKRLCDELSKWLDSEPAENATLALGDVINLYIPAQPAEPKPEEASASTAA